MKDILSIDSLTHEYADVGKVGVRESLDWTFRDDVVRMRAHAILETRLRLARQNARKREGLEG